MTSIAFSEFDSNILGIRVGKTTGRHLTAEALELIRSDFKKTDLDVLFIRALEYHFFETHLINWKGLELADVKVILTTTDPEIGETDDPAFEVTQDIEKRDIDELYKMVAQIARRSRFNRCFGKDAAERIYREWLDNSVAKKAADYCFLARESKTRRPASLVTVKSTDATAELILVAADETYHGRGVGRLLVSHVFSFLREKSISQYSVGCQLDNRSAFRFYNSLGFRFDSFIVDLHLHRLTE